MTKTFARRITRAKNRQRRGAAAWQGLQGEFRPQHQTQRGQTSEENQILYLGEGTSFEIITEWEDVGDFLGPLTHKS